jgi:hypothetical protein
MMRKMRDLVILFVHAVVIFFRLTRPGGLARLSLSRSLLNINSKSSIAIESAPRISALLIESSWASVRCSYAALGSADRLLP